MTVEPDSSRPHMTREDYPVKEDFLDNALRLVKAKRKGGHKGFVEEWDRIFPPENPGPKK